MLILFSPVTLGALGASVFVTVFGLLLGHRKHEVVEHDAEREIQRLTQKVRHPIRARLSRWMGVD